MFLGGQDINQIAKTPQAVGQKDKGHSRHSNKKKPTKTSQINAKMAIEARECQKGLEGGESGGDTRSRGFEETVQQNIIFGLMFAVTNAKS